MIEIDGSFGEGGGQIVRTALALSTITQRACKISSIRHGRSKPGLKAQHVHCIKALEQLCGAKTDGAKLGAETLSFWPGKIRGKIIKVDIGTAGSITLLAQCIFLPSLFANTKVKWNLTGGTDVAWSPQIDYLTHVVIPHLKLLSKNITFKLEARGYYPKGQGKVEIEVEPKFQLNNYSIFDKFHEELKQHPIRRTNQHRIVYIRGISHASQDLQTAEVAERQTNAATVGLANYQCPTRITSEYHNTPSTGSGITIWALFSEGGQNFEFENPIIVGADTLGEKGKKAEDIGTETAKKLIEAIESHAPVDQYLADQLIPYLGLFGGKIETSSISQHTLTNIYATEQFLGKIFQVDEKSNIIKTTYSS